MVSESTALVVKAPPPRVRRVRAVETRDNGTLRGLRVDVLEVCTRIRTALEAINAESVQKFEHPLWSERLGGACGLATMGIVRTLTRMGIWATPVYGWFWYRSRAVSGHAWVLTEDRLLDVTATQFDARLPSLFCPRLTDPRVARHYRPEFVNTAALDWIDTFVTHDEVVDLISVAGLEAE